MLTVETALAERGASLKLVRLAVRERPAAGIPAELLRAAAIDADHIAVAARELVAAAVSAVE